MNFKISSIILGLGALMAVGAVHAGLKSKFKEAAKTHASQLKDQVDSKAASVKGRAKEKRDKITEKAKEKGRKIKGKFLYSTEGGKEVESAESLLLRLDNMVSAEVIIKMIGLMREDAKFQLGKRQAKFDQSKAALEKMLADVEIKIKDLRTKVTQKQEQNIAVFKAAQAGKQEVVDKAQATLDQDNAALLTVLNGLDAFANNNLISGVRDIMVQATAKSKETAQKDLNKYNNDIDALQKKIDKAQDALEKALNQPKFVQQMQNLGLQSNAIVGALGRLIEVYEDFRESDFWNFFESKELDYMTNLTSFSEEAGCSLNLNIKDINMVNENITKLTSCKKNVINGVASKPDVRYLKQDSRFLSLPACSSLTESADISDVEQCIVNYGGIELTSFGPRVVAQ